MGTHSQKSGCCLRLQICEALRWMAKVATRMSKLSWGLKYINDLIEGALFVALSSIHLASILSSVVAGIKVTCCLLWLQLQEGCRTTVGQSKVVLCVFTSTADKDKVTWWFPQVWLQSYTYCHWLSVEKSCVSLVVNYFSYTVQTDTWRTILLHNKLQVYLFAYAKV